MSTPVENPLAGPASASKPNGVQLGVGLTCPSPELCGGIGNMSAERGWVQQNLADNALAVIDALVYRTTRTVPASPSTSISWPS